MAFSPAVLIRDTIKQEINIVNGTVDFSGLQVEYSKSSRGCDLWSIYTTHASTTFLTSPWKRPWRKHKHKRTRKQKDRNFPFSCACAYACVFRSQIKISCFTVHHRESELGTFRTKLSSPIDYCTVRVSEWQFRPCWLSSARYGCSRKKRTTSTKPASTKCTLQWSGIKLKSKWDILLSIACYSSYLIDRMLVQAMS